jgi:hypothetical protein
MAGKLQTIYADDGSLSSGDLNAADDFIAADPNVGQEIIDALTVIRTVLPVLHENLWEMVSFYLLDLEPKRTITDKRLSQ